MKAIYIIIIFATIITSCNTSNNQSNEEKSASKTTSINEQLLQGELTLDPSTYRDTIASLTTDSLKQKFLERIHSLDQEVRHELHKVEANPDSTQDDKEEALLNMKTADATNLALIKEYLSQNDYPSEAFSRNAQYTPWLVIHHKGSITDREYYFPIMYNAYRKDILNDSALTLYLRRLYTMQTGEIFRMEGAYTVEDELRNLAELTGLDRAMNEVDRKQ